MNGIDQDKNMDVSEQAIYWLVKMRNINATKGDRQLFAEWISASKAHQSAFDRQINQFELLGALPATRFDIAEKSQCGALKSVLNGLKQRLRLPEVNWGYPAMTALCVLLMTVFFLPENFESGAVLHYQTARGQVKAITLTDGSVVTLNTDSSLTVRFDSEYRNITLHRGEVFFEVAPNKQQPFTVDLGFGKVVAVGTAFNIYRRQEQSHISITEGRVKVFNDGDETKLADSLFADAGYQVDINATVIAPPHKFDQKDLLSWRNQHIEFKNKKLIEVVEEFNRYLAVPVKLDQLDLQEMKVSGGFQLKHPKDSLNAILSSLNLRMANGDDGLVIITDD